MMSQKKQRSIPEKEDRSDAKVDADTVGWEPADSSVDSGDQPQSPPEIKLLGRFQLLEQLGSGGFGFVYRARDPQLDREVAIKIPRAGAPNADDADRAVREARAAARLRHPNIVPVHDAEKEGEVFYIVTDYIAGQTLGKFLRKQGKMAPLDAAALAAKIADALHFAHSQGIIHRDVKPDNIILDENGEPHLTDFGLARREQGDDASGEKGLVLGTPAYMSPEQARGDSHEADGRTDVWSLGVVLYEMLTGERPFQGKGAELFQKIQEAQPTPLRELIPSAPESLETVCRKCLCKTPAERYSSCEELCQELHNWLETERGNARSKRWPVVILLMAGAAAAGLATAVGLQFLPSKNGEKPQNPPIVIQPQDKLNGFPDQWLHDRYLKLRFAEPIKGLLVSDEPYSVTLEVENRTEKRMNISKINVDTYNIHASDRLWFPSQLKGLVHQSERVDVKGQPIHLAPRKRRKIQMPTSRILPERLIVRIHHDLAKEPTEFEIFQTGLQLAMPRPRQLPRSAIYQGVDGLDAIRKAKTKAEGWSPDVMLFAAFSPNRKVVQEPMTSLDCVITNDWFVTYFSPSKKSMLHVYVDDAIVRPHEQKNVDPKCEKAPFPKIGSQRALELASENNLLILNWSHRFVKLNADKLNPRLAQFKVQGKPAYVWFLPYIGPETAPLTVDAATGHEVRKVKNEFRLFPFGKTGAKNP